MKPFLSELPKLKARSAKRLGRGAGSGKGAKSGRGTTRHQAARENIPLHFEGGQVRVIKKFPLLRGKGRNKPVSPKSFVISFEQLNTFNDGDTVTIETLIEKKLIDIPSSYATVKVLANGELTKKLTVQLPVSQSAKKMIEEKGGSVKEV